MMKFLIPAPTLPRSLGTACLLALAPLAANASPAGLDLTFGAGMVTTKFDNHNDVGRAVVVQGDGKIVLAGYAGNDAGRSDFALVRYLPSGLLDKSFNGTGKVTTAAANSVTSEAFAVTLQPDGKIVAAGGNGSVALVRYNTDASLDTTFNGTGAVTTVFRSFLSRAYAVTVQPDGKIVVAGAYFVSDTSNDSGILVVRYNANGSLDTTFNGSGIASLNPSQGAETVYAVALQADGKIVVTGTIQNSGGEYTFATLRYNTNGKLDATFNGTGIVTTAFTTGNDNSSGGNGVKIQTDGKIVVAGGANNDTNGQDFAVARYNADGSLDTTFNGTGKFTVNFAPAGTVDSDDDAFSIVIQPDGKIVLAGQTKPNSVQSLNSPSFAAARLNVDGSLDTTFNGTGKLLTAVGSEYSVGSAVALSGTKVVIAGEAVDGTHLEFASVVYNTDGSLDTTFHPIGKVTSAIGEGDDIGRAMALQTDGKILVAGTEYNGRKFNFLARYLPDGTRDISFNGAGNIDTAFSSGDSFANSVAVQADGKIVVGGTTRNTQKTTQSYYLVVARYTANGLLDPTFRGTGYYRTDLGGLDPDTGRVAVQPDGKILITGTASDGQTSLLALLRYNSNGTLDTTFNGTGQVTTSFPQGGAAGRDVALQSDGKIVVTADFPGTGTGIATVRYNANGSLDTTFNGNGEAFTQPGTSVSFAHGLVVQPDGKILLAAEAYRNSRKINALVRFNSDGTLDAPFTSGVKAGIVATNVGTGDFVTGGLALQANGEIVVTGAGVNGTDDDVAVLRFTSAGTPDRTFGGTGQVTTKFSGAAAGAAVVVQPDGRIVVAGTTFNGANDDIAVLRYTGGQ